MQFEEKRPSAYSEEIDFVELRCATVPAYAGIRRIERLAMVAGVVESIETGMHGL